MILSNQLGSLAERLENYLAMRSRVEWTVESSRGATSMRLGWGALSAELSFDGPAEHWSRVVNRMREFVESGGKLPVYYGHTGRAGMNWCESDGFWPLGNTKIVLTGRFARVLERQSLTDAYIPGLGDRRVLVTDTGFKGDRVDVGLFVALWWIKVVLATQAWSQGSWTNLLPCDLGGEVVFVQAKPFVIEGFIGKGGGRWTDSDLSGIPLTTFGPGDGLPFHGHAFALGAAPSHVWLDCEGQHDSEGKAARMKVVLTPLRERASCQASFDFSDGKGVDLRDAYSIWKALSGLTTWDSRVGVQDLTMELDVAGSLIESTLGKEWTSSVFSAASFPSCELEESTLCLMGLMRAFSLSNWLKNKVNRSLMRKALGFDRVCLWYGSNQPTYSMVDLV